MVIKQVAVPKAIGVIYNYDFLKSPTACPWAVFIYQKTQGGRNAIFPKYFNGDCWLYNYEPSIRALFYDYDKFFSILQIWYCMLSNRRDHNSDNNKLFLSVWIYNGLVQPYLFARRYHGQ